MIKLHLKVKTYLTGIQGLFCVFHLDFLVIIELT
jgi:hypothetical protein